jgi:hypothetical protein
MESENQKEEESATLLGDEVEAKFSDQLTAFFIRKNEPGEEINVGKLKPGAQKLFLGPGGSREKKWNSIKGPGVEGVAAIKVLRGKAARELRARYPDRIIPSRWHERWKEMED